MIVLGVCLARIALWAFEAILECVGQCCSRAVDDCNGYGHSIFVYGEYELSGEIAR